MATNNQRLSNLENYVHEQTSTIQQLQTQLQDSVTNLKLGFVEKLEQMMKGFEALLAVRATPSNIPSGTSNSPSGSVLGPYEVGSKIDKRDSIFKTIKFEFPKFDGTNPRSWIRKCNKLFAHHLVADNQKIYLATMNLDGEAEEWYSGYCLEGQVITWECFVEEIVARFSPEARISPIGELKNL